jgi:hypothetical protein
LERVLALSLINNHLGFAFLPKGIVYSHKLAVFAFDGWNHFAILQSNLHYHWAWFYSSTNLSLLNYSPSDCFDTFPFPSLTRHSLFPTLTQIAKTYYDSRQRLMLARHEGLTKTYNRFHDPEETAEDTQKLRELHVEMDNAVAAAYGWTDLDLGHGFHETKQGIRYTISEAARREVLARLLKLNHDRYAEEVAKGLHDKTKKGGGKKRISGKAAPQTKSLFDED